MPNPDFNTVLDIKASDVEKPPPRPVGTYIAAVAGLPKPIERTVSGDSRKIMSFPLKMLAPHQVDDLDALEKSDLSSWAPMNKDIWDYNTPDGLYELTSFLKDTLDIEPGDKTVSQMLSESQGRQLLATLIHTTGKDKQGNPTIFTNVGSVAKL